MAGAQLMYLEQMSKVESKVKWVNCSYGGTGVCLENVGFSVLGAGFGFDIDRYQGRG